MRTIYFFSWLFLFAVAHLTTPGAQAQSTLVGLTSNYGLEGGGTAFRIQSDGSAFAIDHTFAIDGQNPLSDLLQASNGKLYGMTERGGVFGYGTIFSIHADGSNHKVLHSFDDINGRYPFGSLIEGTDGKLYGMTSGGGKPRPLGRPLPDDGTIFSIQKDGMSHTVLHRFDGTNGRFPEGSLIEGTDGKLYGMTSRGGSSSFYTYGTIFSIQKDGMSHTVLLRFDETNGSPIGSLIESTDGKLYGVTYGTIFNIQKDGTSHTVLHRFDGTNGSSPSGSLIEGTDGKLYGMTSRGGSTGDGTAFTGDGTIFSIQKDGASHTILHNFNATNGRFPEGSLIEGTDGKLYGMTYFGGSSGLGAGTIFNIQKDGTSHTVLHRFDGTNGSSPSGSLIEGTDGKLYGMTSRGGSTGDGTAFTGDGTIFSIQKDGTSHTVLHNFNATNGNRPSGSLIEGSDGKLYGMTSRGGSSRSGTIFSTQKDGTNHTVLHSFDGNGRFPAGSLIEGTDGKLYGMTSGGGSSGAGTIFSIQKDGTNHTVLHNFNDTNGSSPYGSLIEGTDGKLYGMTLWGGILGLGTIFSIQKDGTSHTVLLSFNATNGSDPYGSLIEGSDGKLYGMTYFGGSSGAGTIFSIQKDGTTHTVLHSFDGNGRFPAGSLIEGTDGKLYGMTTFEGSIFSIQKNGTNHTVLHNFSSPPHGITPGGSPGGSLIEGGDGKLYGMTTYGGGSNMGTIFSIQKDGTNHTVLKNLDQSTGGLPTGSLLELKNTCPTLSFFLINAITNTELFELTDGMEIDIHSLPTTQLSVRVKTCPEPVGSVHLGIGGALNYGRTENIAPYALFGDDLKGHYLPGLDFVLGNYQLSATSYSQANLGGTKGVSKSIQFSITTTEIAPEILSLNLIDANTDLILGDLVDGQEIDISTSPSTSLSIQALANALTESVKFELSGPITHNQTENILPYALFGDNPFDKFNGQVFPAGNYSLQVTPYALDGLSGLAGTGKTIPFTVIASNQPSIVGATLVNANTDQDIRALLLNDEIDLSEVGSALSIRANALGVITKSVGFILKKDDQVIINRVESITPYALLGDTPRRDYIAWTPASGEYELILTPYDQSGGTGTSGTPVVYNFTVVNGVSSRGVASLSYVDEALEIAGEIVKVKNLSPNPLSGEELNIYLTKAVKATVSYTVYDLQGRIITWGSKEVNGETLKLYFRRVELNNGIYMIHLQGEGIESSNLRLVKLN